MRFMEFANAEDQLELWRLISDNVWSAVMVQAKQDAEKKAQASLKAKPKKAKPKKVVAKSPAFPKAKAHVPKPKASNSPVPHQTSSVAVKRSSPLPSSQPVLRPMNSSSFSQADLLGLQHNPQSLAAAPHVQARSF